MDSISPYIHPFEYVDDEGNHHWFLPMGQGPATFRDATALAKDRLGYTHPNLHRRIDNAIKYVLPDGTEVNATYALSINDKNSYRTTQYQLHSESDNESEVP